MKHFFLSFVVGFLVLAGAGCAASNIFSSLSGSDVVEGKWRLAFDLPPGWVMVKEYDSPRKEAVTPSQDVTHDLATILLQSTEKAIVDHGTPGATVSTDTYVTSNYTEIRVDKLDTRRVIPSDATDLGKGFSYAEGKYYYQTESGEKYQFTVTASYENSVEGYDALNDSTVKAIVLSARPVTKYTDTQAAGSVDSGDVKTNE